jgi:hypothetical protein
MHEGRSIDIIDEDSVVRRVGEEKSSERVSCAERAMQVGPFR